MSRSFSFVEMMFISLSVGEGLVLSDNRKFNEFRVIARPVGPWQSPGRMCVKVSF